ncbi:MAG: DNA-processing protein DprA [Candidatus Gastranaerophilales bacterium]|nr:DNA-processing protein DprA [Candidatus Gastranaerophilales bacterium]
MSKLKYFAAFASDESFGCKFVKRLYDYFEGDIERAWNASSFELQSIEGITKKKIEKFTELRNKINPDEEADKIAAENISLLTYDDDDYPTLLRQIDGAPMWLYYIGNRELFNAKYNMAVVGSRKCSQTAKAVLAKIIAEFKSTDLCVTSGLAAGIDAAAHQAALENNLSTIAVLGSGLKNVYPTSNKNLFRDIIEKNGLVVSEYPINAEPDTYHFPMRNRIVSGLCPCTLVAEAALKSGALITARLCLEQNRELMCIPGAISNPATQGIYKLLKEGAGIVTCGKDILDIMSWKTVKKSLSKNKAETSACVNGLNEDENRVLEILRQDSLNIDEISLKTGFQVDDLMIILTRLEIEDLIIQAEGGIYSAV